MAKARVLLADDDAVLASLLQEYLCGDGFSVSVVLDGSTAVKAALKHEHDLIVLDVTMPVMDGIEALRHIRKKSEVPVIMLTARGDDIDRILGLELGADDYVHKPCTPRELSARISAIMRRLHPAQADSRALCAGVLSLWPAQRRVELRGKPMRLTSTEFNILELLLRKAGSVVDKHVISERAIGRKLARFDRSIDVHLSSIRQKLGEDAGMILTVRGTGYHLIKE